MINRLQRRRIDQFNVTEVVKDRERRFASFIDAEDQSQAEPWLRLMDTRRADSVVRKRLTPEACIKVLDSLRANVQERGPSPEEDMEVLGRVYGQESTTLGAAIVFHYQLIKASHYQPDEGDEKRKAEYEELREIISKHSKQKSDFITIVLNASLRLSRQNLHPNLRCRPLVLRSLSTATTLQTPGNSVAC